MATRTLLMRNDLRPLYTAAIKARTGTAHPGLLLQRGLPEHSEGDSESKARHIARVCEGTAGDFYDRAYRRWRHATADPKRFRSVILKIQTRLFIGLTGSGMLETGCVVGHSHGMPCIPGSSVKGIVSAHARERLGTDGRAICDELFGAPTTEDRPSGLPGLIFFHDAWWTPGSAESPFTQEVVTTHHRDYYGQEGRKPATDCDSPVPNAQVAVRGEFLFVIEGPDAWLDLAEQMLVATLTTRGAGARTRAGYGLFTAETAPAPESRCEWVDREIARLSAENHASDENTLRSRGLAQAWVAIEDAALKRAAFADIRARWQEKGWWEDVPRGKSARTARALYNEHSTEKDACTP